WNVSGYMLTGLPRTRSSSPTSSPGTGSALAEGSGFFPEDRRTAFLWAMAASSASCQECPENVGVFAVVMPEGEFVHVERQVFLADLVERTHDAALQERPERIEVRGMH